MTIDLRKTSHILFFAALLPALSIGLGWLSAQLIPNAPFWVETVSPLAAYGLLYALFDKFVWHWPMFRWLGIVTAPDVRGRWLGDQISSYRDKNSKNLKSRVILEITQTFSSIHVQPYYKNWQSTHTICSCIDIDGTPTLMIMFETEPKAIYDGDAAAHKGVVKLVKLPNDTLRGTYFNANGNHGELTVRRTMYKLHHTFEAVRK